MGFCSFLKPRIHIFAGEKVWHQVMMPMQSSSALTLATAASISSLLLQVVRYLTVTGMYLLTYSAISSECCATCSSTSAPYSVCEPVIQ